MKPYQTGLICVFVVVFFLILGAIIRRRLSYRLGSCNLVKFMIMKCFLCRPLESSSDCDPSLGPIDPQEYRSTKLVDQVRQILLTFSFEKLVNQMLISPNSTGQASHERTDSQATWCHAGAQSSWRWLWNCDMGLWCQAWRRINQDARIKWRFDWTRMQLLL